MCFVKSAAFFIFSEHTEGFVFLPFTSGFKKQPSAIYFIHTGLMVDSLSIMVFTSLGMLVYDKKLRRLFVDSLIWTLLCYAPNIPIADKVM